MRRASATGTSITKKVAMSTAIRSSSGSNGSGHSTARGRMTAVSIMKPQVDLKEFRFE